MRPGEAIADIDRYGARLAESLLETIDPIRGGFGRMPQGIIDPAVHQLVWRHYMATGEPRFGEAVIASLRTISRSALVDHVDGGVSHRDAADARPAKTLGHNAQLLELLTWVWRQCRCPELRRCAEGIAAWAVARMRVPGCGFAARVSGDDRDGRVFADRNGLMLVALVEAGSVFERRDWLALSRTVLDELVVDPSDGAWRLDDYAMMTKAAIRLFEAFGKPRYLKLAEAWVATLDDAFWDIEKGAYRTSAAVFRAPSPTPLSITDAALPSGNALMIGVLARLHAMTGATRYAERAERLVEAFHRDIQRCGIAAATAVANVQTLAQLVTIKVAGDPKLPETRELMRVALDCALPDRLVLGPGAGDAADASPRARVLVGPRSLAPIMDVAKLRAVTAPGGLSNAS